MYLTNKEGNIINKNDGSLVIDTLSKKPLHIDNLTGSLSLGFNRLLYKHILDNLGYNFCDNYIINKTDNSLVIDMITHQPIYVDILINNLIDKLNCLLKYNNLVLNSNIISKNIIEIMKLLNYPKKIHNMLLSLIPNNCDILLKIVNKLGIISFSDFSFLFNNYSYLLNIELIQNKFLLNNDIIDEIKKVLIIQAIKEDIKTILFISDHNLTYDICKLAVILNFKALQFVPDHILTDDIIRLGIEIDGFAFLYIQEEKRTEEIIKLAIKSLAIKKDNFFTDIFDHISKEKITDEIIKYIIKEAWCDFNIFQYIPKDKITDEIIKLAIKKEFIFSEMFEYIPENKITDEIIELAKLYNHYL
jgi:hypothetical protein